MIENRYYEFEIEVGKISCINQDRGWLSYVRRCLLFIYSSISSCPLFNFYWTIITREIVIERRDPHSHIEVGSRKFHTLNIYAHVRFKLRFTNFNCQLFFGQTFNPTAITVCVYVCLCVFEVPIVTRRYYRFARLKRCPNMGTIKVYQILNCKIQFIQINVTQI